MTSFACLLHWRLRNPRLPAKAQWNLGRWGLAVNAEAFRFTAFVFFWSFCPDFTPVTPENFNWAPIMFFITLVIAYTHWLLPAQHTYVPSPLYEHVNVLQIPGLCDFLELPMCLLGSRNNVTQDFLRGRHGRHVNVSRGIGRRV